MIERGARGRQSHAPEIHRQGQLGVHFPAGQDVSHHLGHVVVDELKNLSHPLLAIQPVIYLLPISLRRNQAAIPEAGEVMGYVALLLPHLLTHLSDVELPLPLEPSEDIQPGFIA